MKIAVLGGGPGGLFLARLLKKARPDFRVRVFEQNPPDATYGFGVGISMGARDRMRECDPEVFDALQARSHFNRRQLIRRNDECLQLEFAQGSGAIRRLDLLKVLMDACVQSGVDLRFGERAKAEELEAYHDVVVAADGVNSSLRGLFAEPLQVQVRPRQNHFAWFGVQRELTPSGLSFLRTDAGIFVGHYYAYGADQSTFLPECDEATWQRSGFAQMDDAQRKAEVEKLFVHELQGAPLLENRSIWRTFDAVHCQRWHHGKFVLIGGALRVAHFSIGSGTRLAMEDALALFDAIREGGATEEMFRRYQAARQPVRDRFGMAADRSIDWYESLAPRMQLPMVEFVYDFLTRTGRVDDARLASYAPGFFRQWQEYAARRPGLTSVQSA